jgi:hypothetical protein
MHIYDTSSQSFEEVKMSNDNTGVLSCLTQSTFFAIKAMTLSSSASE